MTYGVTMTSRELISAGYQGFVDYIKQMPTTAIINEVRKNETLTLTQLRELQEREFKNLISDVFISNLYFRNKIEGAGLARNVNLSEISRIPSLTKDEIRNNLNMMRGVPQGKFFKGTTSGSTGVSLTFLNDSLSLAWADACKWRGRNWLGANRYTSSLVLWGQPLHLGKGGKWLSGMKHWLRNIYFFNTFNNLDDTFLEKICTCIVAKKPQYIYGYGSSVAALARYMRDRNVKVEYKPLFIQFTADHMSAQERRLAEDIFGCRVVSDYGSSEAPGIAEECECGNLHISVDHYVVEILDENDYEVPIGEIGEVTVTALHNIGFPFIRYRTGDLGRKLNEVCDCGIELPLFHLEAGKSVDLISTSEAKNVSAHILDYINLSLMRERVTGIAQFFLEQVSIDDFRLKIVREQPFSDESVDIFLRELRAFLGSSIHIEILFVDHIPVTPSGKRRYFAKADEFVWGVTDGED